MTSTTLEFESFLKNRWPFALGVVVILILAGAAATVWNQRQNTADQIARDNLYQALTLLKQEETIAKDKKFASAAEVQQAFAKGMEAIQKIAQTAKGSRAGFEAELKLGDLYAKRGFAAEALPYYQSAASHAPRSLDQALTLISVGYTLEALQKPAEAVAALEKALALGEASLQGELMLSIARVKRGAGDSAGAKAMYEKVIKLLPNTEYAKTAETLQAF